MAGCGVETAQIEQPRQPGVLRPKSIYLPLKPPVLNAGNHVC